MESVVHWLTLRGLHTDHLEAFAADHRLSFRGLPAEGLGVETHEAASFPTPLSTNGELRLQPPEGLSLAAWSLSNARDAARGNAAASRFSVGDLLGGSVSTGPGQAFLGEGLLVAGC